MSSDNWALVGLCALPFLLSAVFWYPDIIYYFIILDSWSIVRIGSIKLANTPITVNSVLFLLFSAVFLYQFRKYQSIFLLANQKIFFGLISCLLAWMFISFYSWTRSINFNLINNFIFFYISLLFFQLNFSKKLKNIAIIAFICAIFISTTMLYNDIIHGALGQKSYAGNRIHSAFYIYEGITLSFFLKEWYNRNTFISLLIALFISLAYLSIFTSLGRMVTFIAFVSVIYFLFKGYIKWYVCLVILLTCCLIFLFNINYFYAFKDKLLRKPKSQKSLVQYNQEELAAFTSGRSRAYKAAWRIFLKKPLTGFGYNRWSLDFNRNSPGASLHSRWLQILVETGPIGMILYLSIFLAALKRLINSKTFKPGFKQPVRDALFMALVGFFFIGLTDNHGYSDRIFYLLIALIASYRGERQGTEEAFS